MNRANSYDQTALDIVTTYTTTRAARDLKQLLKGQSLPSPIVENIKLAGEKKKKKIV